MITVLWVGFSAQLLGMCFLAPTTRARVALVVLAVAVAAVGMTVELAIVERIDGPGRTAPPRPSVLLPSAG